MLANASFNIVTRGSKYEELENDPNIQMQTQIQYLTTSLCLGIYVRAWIEVGSIQYVDEWRGISIRRRIALKCNPLLKAESPLQVTDSKTARPRMPPAPSCAPA